MIITETTKIPQAIPYYLAEKSGHPEFMGKDAEERAKVRMLEGVMADIRLECFRIIDMGKNADHKSALKQLFDKKGPTYQKIAALSQFLGSKDFFFDHLTWVDFMMQFTARFTGAIVYSQLGYSPYADLQYHLFQFIIFVWNVF